MFVAMAWLVGSSVRYCDPSEVEGRGGRREGGGDIRKGVEEKGGGGGERGGRRWGREWKRRGEGRGGKKSERGKQWREGG